MTKQPRADSTRERLLAAAQVCFAEQGYEGASVAAICEHAGVSKGAFYHHFPSKQDLFLALLNHWLKTLAAQMEHLRSQQNDVQTLLPAIAALLPAVFQDASGQLPMFLEFWNQAARDPAIWKATTTPLTQYHAFFAAAIQESIAANPLPMPIGASLPTDASMPIDAPSVDAQRAARVIVSFGLGLLLYGLLRPDDADWAAVGKHGVDILLAGLQRK